MDKLLTVSIANYNNAAKLDASISSLLDKNILDAIDVIIVNDGSKDNSLEVIKKYVDQYPNTVRLIDKPNGGYGSTINESLKIAKGKYYRLLDADDLYNTANLVQFVQLLKDLDVDYIYTDFSLVNITTGKKEPITYDYPKNELLNVSVIKEMHMHSVTIKTELIKNKVNITEHCFYTDLEFSIKAMEKAESFIYIPLEIYLYNIGNNEQSISKAGYIKHAREHEHIVKTLLSITKNNDKFTALNEGHINHLITDQLYVYLLDKKYKDDFYRYAEFAKNNYPEIFKKAKIYIKLAVKSQLFYNLFSKLL